MAYIFISDTSPVSTVFGVVLGTTGGVHLKISISKKKVARFFRNPKKIPVVSHLKKKLSMVEWATPGWRCWGKLCVKPVWNTGLLPVSSWISRRWSWLPAATLALDSAPGNSRRLLDGTREDAYLRGCGVKSGASYTPRFARFGFSKN